MRVGLVSDGGVLPPAALPGRAAAAARAGVDWIQIREKGMGGAALLELLRQVRAAVAQAGGPRGPVPVLVNGRLDVALAGGADGVHLPARGLPAADVRRLAPRPFLVGVSAHTPAELAAAAAAGADYALYGPVFPTASHPGAAPLGRAGLAAALAGALLPVWAIGGVSPGTAQDLAGLPLEGCAAIRSLLLAPDLPAAVAALRAVPTSPPSPPRTG